MNRNIKRTENGDIAYKSTGNKLLDILFMTPYFENHLDKVSIGSTEKEQMFSMFVRDPRFGLGRRDLGRHMMYLSDVSIEHKVKAGRFDDLFYPTPEKFGFKDVFAFMKQEIEAGNELAKKWMPRLNSKNRELAKLFCKEWKMTQQDYRAFIKCDSTTEFKLSYAEDIASGPQLHIHTAGNYTHPLVNEINFEQVPSLAMIKYFNAFLKRPDTSERFKKYLDGVKKGEKELKVTTTTVYDIFRNRDKIDADLFFDKLEKIEINCLPILDTSGSMWDGNDSIGKAVSIAHYLAKCSTYCKDVVMAFSKNPRLIEIKEENKTPTTGYYGRQNSGMWGNKTKYQRELNSMYTGDAPENTDFAKVIAACSKLKVLPEYFVVLSDMEFDKGSNKSKVELQKLWAELGITTKIVWWNFNTRNATVPEIDEMGNIFLSGYTPQMLKLLEAGFDGNKYLDKLLEEYKKNLKI
jgi:hypothetical protein